MEGLSRAQLTGAEEKGAINEALHLLGKVAPATRSALALFDDQQLTNISEKFAAWSKENAATQAEGSEGDPTAQSQKPVPSAMFDMDVDEDTLLNELESAASGDKKRESLAAVLSKHKRRSVQEKASPPKGGTTVG